MNPRRNLVEVAMNIALDEQMLPTGTIARMGKRYADIKKSRTPDNPLGERPVDFEKNFPNLAATDEFDALDKRIRGYRKWEGGFPGDLDSPSGVAGVVSREIAKKYGLPIDRLYGGTPHTTDFGRRPKDKDIEREKKKYFSTGYSERNPEESGVKPKVKPWIPMLGGR